MTSPTSYHHTIDIALDPPLASAGEANLWVEIATGAGVDPGGLSHAAPTGCRPEASRPTLVLSRVDGDGTEQRFALPHGAYRRFGGSKPVPRLRRPPPPARDASRNETISSEPNKLSEETRARRDRRLTLVPSFSIHAGARAEGIRAKRRKSGYQLRVTVPVVEDPAAEEPTATKERTSRPGSPRTRPGTRAIDPPRRPSLVRLRLTRRSRRRLARSTSPPWTSARAATRAPRRANRETGAWWRRDPSAGECVVFEAPVAAVKAGSRWPAMFSPPLSAATRSVATVSSAA